MSRVKLPYRKHLITYILILIALWFGACRGGVLPEKDSEDFRFVFATDVHLMPHEQAFEGFNQAIIAINGLKPEPHFVIMGGDLVENKYTRTLDNAEKMFDLYHQTTKRIKRLTALDIYIHFINKSRNHAFDTSEKGDTPYFILRDCRTWLAMT